MANDNEQQLAEHDIQSKVFWDGMTNIFSQTKELILMLAKEQGIDLSAIDEDELKEYTKKAKRRRQKSEQNEIAKSARAYGKLVDDWLESSSLLFKEKTNSLSALKSNVSTFGVRKSS